MFLRPQSVHQWRQCDSAAYALNYYQNDAAFFYPETMTLMAEQGRTISEFPILYYLTSLFYRLFGYDEFWLRLLTYSVFVVGLLYLLRLGLRFFSNPIWAYITPLFLVASPVLSYYALNYLPNVPAFALSLGVWYYFFKFLDSRQIKDFIWCSVLACLAALLKPVEIFNYLIAVSIILMEVVGLFGLTKVKYRLKELGGLFLLFALTIGLNIAWVYYAKWYAHKFGFHGNLLSVLPIWDMEKIQITDTIQILKTKWGYQLYHPLMFKLVILFSILILAFFRRVNRQLFLAWLLSVVAQLVYVLLFFQTFYHHDYYWINCYIVVVLTLLCFFQIVENYNIRLLKNTVLGIITIFLLFNLKHSRHIILERYYGFLKEGVNPSLERITPYLRTLGIKREDYVVSIPDLSPNVSLYLMNQKGWTESFKHDNKDMEFFISKGAKYFIVNKNITTNTDWYFPYMRNQIGEFEGIKIYRLNN